MIYTCTLNPALDYFVRVENFQIGQLNRMDSDKKMPGGKGINVSRVLKRLGVRSQTLGFIGGFTGDYIRRLLIAESIDTDFVEVDGDTRINVKVKSDNETELNGVSPNVERRHINELLLKLDRLSEGDLLVLSGSLPQKVPADIYKQIIEHLSGRKIKVIVDTSGKALEEVVGSRPFLVKPNHEELGQMFDTRITTTDDALLYARKLIEKGVSNVIVSMGGEGALFVNQETAVHAVVPKRAVKNSVGAGDSLVGGFLAEYLRSNDIQKAFRYGTAAGSATAFSVDLCTKATVDQLVADIELRQI